MRLVDINFAGKAFKLNDVDGTDQVAAQMTDGSYEAPLPFLMMATFGRVPGIFLDVGANTGVYTILAALFKKTETVLAFEPNPDILGALDNNIKANGLSGSVALHQVALSDKAGVAQLYIPDHGLGLLDTSATLEKDFQPSKRSVSVDVRRLDDLDIPDRVAVIKLDIEGHEHAALDGGRALINRDRPFMFVEVLSVAKLNALNVFVQDMHYVDFRLRPDMVINDGRVNFDNSAWNHVFVPQEGIEKFKEICDSCGLAMLRKYQFG